MLLQHSSIHALLDIGSDTSIEICCGCVVRRAWSAELRAPSARGKLVFAGRNPSLGPALDVL